MRFRVLLSVGAWVLALFAAGGCAQPGTAARVAQSQPASGDVWQIVPKTMRVYPSSRIVERESGALLEARIELFDEAGDSTKAVGTFRFELYPRENDQADQANRLYNWDVPVVTLTQNQKHYDPVTQAYLFRLKLTDQALVGREVFLLVGFEPVSGGHLNARAVLAPEK